MSNVAYNLFLDDERFPYQVKWVQIPDVQWVIARSFNKFVKLIQRDGLPAKITFDHDLGYEATELNSNGNDCLVWLLDHCFTNKLPLPECYFHSMNMERRHSMRQAYYAARERQDDYL